MSKIKTLVLFLIVTAISLACTQDSDAPNSESVAQQEIKKNTVPVSFADAYKIVDEMPLFGDCADKTCSDKKLIEYLSNNLQYPKDAREAGLEGKVYVQFIIEKDGSVTNVHLARGLGGGLDDAAMTVIHDINKVKNGFQAGKQNGEAVKVMYTVPIAFRLEGKAS